MGEASRRLKARKAFMARRISCRYSLGTVVHALVPEFEDGEFVDDGAVDDILCFVRAPNAMRPVGFAKAGDGFHDALWASMFNCLTDGGDHHLFDDAGAFLGTMPADAFAVAYTASSYDRRTFSTLRETPFRLTGTLQDGLGDDGGNRVSDPVSLLSGMVRIDAHGRFLVAADAPLTIQFAALLHLANSGGLDEEASESVRDHILQLSMLHSHVEANRSGLPDAWMDLREAGRIAVEMSDPEPDLGAVGDTVLNVALGMTLDLDLARRDDPSWAITALIGIDPEDWDSRDTPGSGEDWFHLDRDLRLLLGDGSPLLPGADAQFVAPENDMRTLASFRDLMRKGETVVSKGSSSVARDADLGLVMALISGIGRSTVVVWREGADIPARRDPLMAESLVGLTDEPPRPSRPTDASYREGIDLLTSLSLLSVLPLAMPDSNFPILMLLAAHRRGRTIPDLCASVAEVLRDGGADAAFRSRDDDMDDEDHDPFAVIPLTADEAGERAQALAKAEAFGGAPDEPLTAMLRFLGDDGWADLEVLRDLALLGDAVRAGMTLEDMCIAGIEACNALMDIGEDD